MFERARFPHVVVSVDRRRRTHLSVVGRSRRALIDHGLEAWADQMVQAIANEAPATTDALIEIVARYVAVEDTQPALAVYGDGDNY